MICYSSSEFFQDWRYAVRQEFSDAGGKPFSYATDGQQQWDDEVHKISLKDSVEQACISSDGKRLVLVQGRDIHVFDTKSWELVSVLKGHTNDIEAVAFQPGNPNVLVSSQRGGRAADNEEVIAECIIIWHLDHSNDSEAPADEAIDKAIADTAAAASKNLNAIGVNVAESELRYLEKCVAPHVRYVVSKYVSASRTQIHGWFTTSFQSEVFSPSGKFMAYLPGKSPRSNRSDPWDLCICDTETFQPKFTLKGHTDNVMWTGWNSDETLFGSVSWDGTIRIWDAATGEELHKFTTDHQNWTGGFSPDSKYFAATKGTGGILVYALEGKTSATEHWCYRDEGSERWKRALDWHPNSKWLAVGVEDKGELLLLDVEQKELLKERTLSYEACVVDEEEKRSILRGYLGVNRVKFVDGGRKIVFYTFGDGSFEVYDLEDKLKWRFGRGGTDNGPRADKWKDDKGKVTTEGGYNTLVWEDFENGKVMLASLDGEEVRIWSVEMSSRTAA